MCWVRGWRICSARTVKKLTRQIEHAIHVGKQDKFRSVVLIDVILIDWCNHQWKLSNFNIHFGSNQWPCQFLYLVSLDLWKSSTLIPLFDDSVEGLVIGLVRIAKFNNWLWWTDICGVPNWCQLGTWCVWVTQPHTEQHNNTDKLP